MQSWQQIGNCSLDNYVKTHSLIQTVSRDVTYCHATAVYPRDNKITILSTTEATKPTENFKTEKAITK